MSCGNCDKTDGLCYTSNPPKVKCTVTGRFHGYDDECDVKTCEITPSLAASCIICGEDVELSQRESFDMMCGLRPLVKVCDNCKDAILQLRAELRHR